MSQFFTATATCPVCTTVNTLDYPASVNADRRDDLRRAILDGSLYTMPCTNCGQALTFEPHVTYLDVARGQWILADAADAVAGWRAAEAQALGVFDLAFGAAASAPARALGAALTPRLVFGWPALVEKLRCRDLGLDDATLEVMKLVLLRDGPEHRLDPAHDLRLHARAEDALLLDRVDPASGQATERLRVPVGLYDDILAAGDAWAPLRALLAGRMFVDAGRVLHDPPPAGAQ